MTDWKNQLGRHFLQKGALSYIITDDNTKVNWYKDGRVKPQIDMVVFYKDHVEIIELKETTSVVRRRIRAKQTERYYYFCKDVRYHTQFWVYLYWKPFKTIVGTRVDHKKNMKFFVDTDADPIQFWTSVGEDTENPIIRGVEFKMRAEND